MHSFNLKRSFLIPAAVIGVVSVWAILKAVYRYKKKICFRKKSERNIHVIESAEAWERVLPDLTERTNIIKAVGFDCEWVFWGKRLPVALIQIATFDGFCVLVRIHKMTDSIPKSLERFLSDRSILKVGVSATDDGKKLWKDYGMSVSGCVDLRFMLSRVRGYHCHHQGLQGLAEGILGVAMVKDPAIRCGNWEAEELSPDQVIYAADDALIAMDIFMQLVSVKIFGMMPRGSYYGGHVEIDEVRFWQNARSLCQGIVDVGFKNNRKSPGKEMAVDSLQLSDKEVTQRKNKSRETKAYMTRQTPLYYNCRLLAPDGALLTTCDISKATWYINKKLGEKVCDDPMTVKLNFEPVARPTSEQDYYLQDKENICVVCGSSENYIRKLVVPQEYRKYFPTILKDHSSHDVLLMCLSCHARSGNYDSVLRQKLAQECDAPLDSGKGSKTTQDQDLQKVVSAAKALIKSGNQIPEQRVVELQTVVKNFYGVSSLSEELLNRALKIDIRVHNADFVPHGKRVVDYYMNREGGLLEFEKIWRKQFVETMEPKFLPHLWSIDHLPERMVLYNGTLIPKTDIPNKS